MLRKDTSLQWTKQVLSLYSSEDFYTTSPCSRTLRDDHTGFPLYMYIYIYVLSPSVSCLCLPRSATAMAGELASPRAMPMTFSKGVEGRTEGKGRQKKKFSSGKPHCLKGAPVSWAAVAGIEALVDVVETSLVGPLPGLHELCWPGVHAGWLARPRMKPRVCDGCLVRAAAAGVGQQH